MKYGVTLHSIIPMRAEPREQAEMISQLLFGECYSIADEEKQWLQIQTQFDNYRGWIDRKLFAPVSEPFYKRYQTLPSPVVSSLITCISLKDETPFLIVSGSSLPGYDEKNETVEIEGKVYQLLKSFETTTEKGLFSITKTAEKFLNSPYLWGGRSLFGFDCSGFVQVVYKIHGIMLPRNSAQQARQGEVVSSLKESRTGDLAFFANAEGQIIHTGILLSPDEIIHCSGYVRKDKIDDTGIFNSKINEYTHRLTEIRRF